MWYNLSFVNIRVRNYHSIEYDVTLLVIYSIRLNNNKGNAKRGVSPLLKIDPVTLTFDLENQ